MALAIVVLTGVACETPTSPSSTQPTDSVHIAAITPDDNLAVDHEMRFVVRVDYTLVTASTANLELAVNDESAQAFRPVASRLLDQHSGEIEVVFLATPREWGEEATFKLQVSLHLDGSSRVRRATRNLRLYAGPTRDLRDVEAIHLFS